MEIPYHMPRLFYTHASCAGAVQVIGKIQELLRLPQYLEKRLHLADIRCRVFVQGEVIEVPKDSVAVFDGNISGMFSPVVTEDFKRTPPWAMHSKWGVVVGNRCVATHREEHCASYVLAVFSNNGVPVLQQGQNPWGPKRVQRPYRKREFPPRLGWEDHALSL